MQARQIVIVEAPSTLGLTSVGVERLPAVLQSHGLAQRLGARPGGRVQPKPREGVRDADTLILNARAMADYAVALADEVGDHLDRGDVPLVLGGDCTILLGNLLALHRRGRFGLLFIDGHADFYQPAAEPNGEGASMELGFATGRGPDVVANIEGRRPLVRDGDVVVFGRRDADEARQYGSQRIEDTPIRLIDLERIRGDGIERCIEAALDHVVRADLEGFWLHVDADVLDDAIMPAVDYRMPGGLQWDELAAAIAGAWKTGKLVGMNVTIFNPALDRDGSIGAKLADTLVRGLGGLGDAVAH